MYECCPGVTLPSLRTYAGYRVLRYFPLFVLDHVRLVYPPQRGLWLARILVILGRLQISPHDSFFAIKTDRWITQQMLRGSRTV